MEKNEEILFDYVDENGVSKKAEVLTFFKLDGNDKQYALCSIPANDGNYDVTAFIVNDLNDGTLSFDDIESDEEFAQVSALVNEMMG